MRCATIWVRSPTIYTPPGYKKRLVRRVLNELRRQKLPAEG